MQPAARYSAAIGILDEILAGQPAEKALAGWARAHRFAGSKDRAAIRDIVFDVLRVKRSASVAGGGTSGRLLVLGALRLSQIDPTTVFGAGGHAPDALNDTERTGGDSPEGDDLLNLPQDLIPIWRDSLGAQAKAVALSLQSRAPVCLRVNLTRGAVDQAREVLAQDGIEVRSVDGVPTALIVTQNPRRINGSKALGQGLIEVQDTASQEAVAALKLTPETRVLDYCAGGGGKALAIADMYRCSVTAHDVNPARTKDIAPRAARAGLQIDVIETEELQHHPHFDLVFCDAPCSGAGTWRRTPAAKWAMTQEKLQSYQALQSDAVGVAAAMVRLGGRLVYATCSVLRPENEDAIADLVASGAFRLEAQKLRLPDALGDGFYWAHLTRVI